jgi:hypothetical protein
MTIDQTTHGFGELVATIEHIGGTSVDNDNSVVTMSGVEMRLDNGQPFAWSTVTCASLTRRGLTPGARLRLVVSQFQIDGSRLAWIWMAKDETTGKVYVDPGFFSESTKERRILGRWIFGIAVSVLPSLLMLGLPTIVALIGYYKTKKALKPMPKRPVLEAALNQMQRSASSATVAELGAPA